MRLKIIAATLSLAGVLAANAGTPSDQWALTDALGRKSRSHKVAGDKNDGKFVGMFYWTWHQTIDHDDNGGKDNKRNKVKNITEVLRKHPEAIRDYNHPVWGVGEERPGTFYWDEPLFGYYRTDDKWVLRKHAEMLADAGVDAVFFDCTNGSILWDTSVKALMETWTQAQKDGVDVPKIVFMLPFMASPDSRKSLLRLYETIYGKGEYEHLWFYWKGKPLIMAYPDNLEDNPLENEIRDFFTFRPGQPDYVEGPKRDDHWGWLEIYPTHGYAADPQTGKYEQAVVGVGQNARWESGGHCCAFNLPGTFGRSHTRTLAPDMRDDAYLYGGNIQEQWDRAIDQLDPEMVFVTGWNEWTSGMWNSSHGWSDPVSFVDQFDGEHSRDIEPTRGWGDKGDVYYQQLVDNVRRFKGMEVPEQASAPKSIRLGHEEDWTGVLPHYTAYRGNTMHRDADGRYDMHYTDTSGRNDITGARVAHDRNNVFFRIETAERPTPSGDPNWMMLFIDADCDRSTGWNGYDYIVNRVSPTGNKVTVERCTGSEWEWEKAGEGELSVTDRSVEMRLPKKVLRMGAEPVFEFKCADGLTSPGDVLDFYVSGDVAPGGRFNYVYCGSK